MKHLGSAISALALSLCTLGTFAGTAHALPPSFGPRNHLLAALNDGASLMSQAEGGGSNAAAALLKAHDTLWPAVEASLRPLLHRVPGARRRLAGVIDDQHPGLAALHQAALNAGNHTGMAQLRAALQTATGLAGQLSGPLGSLFASAISSTPGSETVAPAHRKLAEQPGQQLAHLATRFHNLGAARSALSETLHDTLGLGSSTHSNRRLQQAEKGEREGASDGGDMSAQAEAEEAWWWLGEDGSEPLLPEGPDMYADIPDFVVYQEVQLVPVATDMLSSMLLLVRDAVDLALRMASPAPAWAGAYTGDYWEASGEPLADSQYPFEEPQVDEQSVFEEPQADAFNVQEDGQVSKVDASTQAGEPAAAGRRRRLRQAGGVTPPLPAGNPPRQLAEDDDDGDYSEEQYSEEDYSESEYNEFFYYGALDDWLFDDPLEWYVVQLARLNRASADAPPAPASAVGVPSTAPASAVEAEQPTLPVFAVFAGSSHAAVVPSNETSQPGKKSGVIEALIAPFSAEARTPVPHSDGQSLPFDPRYFGIVCSFALLLALALGMAVVMRRSRSRAANTDQQESLLYSHIPGTPSRAAAAKAGSAASGTQWQAGAGSASGATGPVPKKLSNLPA